MRHGILTALLLFATGSTAASAPSQRTPTFDDRVNAQATLERGNYSHQVYKPDFTCSCDESAAPSAQWLQVVPAAVLPGRYHHRMVNGSARKRALADVAG